MNYKIKQVWVSLIVSVVLLLIFINEVFQKYQSLGLEAFDQVRSLAGSMLFYMLLFVIVTIASMIIMSVLHAISTQVRNEILSDDKKLDIDEAFDDTKDEMDKLISLKANTVGYVISGTGFFIGLILVYFDQPFGLLMTFVFVSFFIANIAESIAKIYLYNRGVYHG